MKRFVVFFILGCLFFLPSIAHSQDRFSNCDACGYCPSGSLTPTPPQDWEKCRECLYPEANSDPGVKDTLKIDPATNLAPAVALGRQYTLIGCIRTDLGGFNQEGAATSLAQIILNLVFALLGGIAFLYLLYGSFIILTSQADPERLNYGKRIIYGAIIGVIFSVSSLFLIGFIASGVLKIPGIQTAP